MKNSAYPKLVGFTSVVLAGCCVVFWSKFLLNHTGRGFSISITRFPCQNSAGYRSESIEEEKDKQTVRQKINYKPISNNAKITLSFSPSYKTTTCLSSGFRPSLSCILSFINWVSSITRL